MDDIPLIFELAALFWLFVACVNLSEPFHPDVQCSHRPTGVGWLPTPAWLIDGYWLLGRECQSCCSVDNHININGLVYTWLGGVSKLAVAMPVYVLLLIAT
jgi:hypothetical protein